LKFLEQEIPTDFEHTARNYVRNIFQTGPRVTYGLTKKEALKPALNYGTENVIVPEG
jgi:hypothetical protein